MSSTQRSHSAPSGDRRAASGPENVQSPERLSPGRWPSIRSRQAQHHDESPGPSREEVKATTAEPNSVTHSNSSVLSSEAGQESDHTAATHSSGGSNGQSPWYRKTLLTLGTCIVTMEGSYD